MIIKQITSSMHSFSIGKLLASLIWVATLSLFTINAYGASKTYSFSLQKIPFEAAVNYIEDKTDYSFVYNTKLIKKGTVVSLEVKNAGIEKVVTQLIKGLPISYEIKNRRIFLSDKKANLRTSLSENGKRLVSGRVLDENGEPLVGATISIPEAKIYAVTDADGNYTVSVPDKFSKSKLQVSYVGFSPKSISLKDRTELDITMQSNSQVLSDLVVVGYGTQKRESLTSAISTVSSEDISRSAATNTSGALVGKVAGINSRMSDGRPGSYTAINIRNMGTPLYVVDGVQMDEGQFNNIDFNDIENISVLKDASAAIYGVRAANGVVVVTTKSGKRNHKNTVNINAYYGWQEMMRFPKPADAVTYVESQIQSSTVRGFDSKYSKEDLEKWRKGTEKGYQGFDWYDFIFNSAPQWYTSANISGGSDKIDYYIAMSHLRQDAIIVNYGNFHRTNIQFNLNADITDRFKIGASINGRLQEELHPGVPQSDDFLTAIWATTNLPTVRPFANDNPKYPALVNQAGYTNFAILNFEQSGTNRDRWKVMQFNLSAEYELIKNLKLKGLFSYFYANRRWDNQENSYKLYAYNEKTDTYNVVMNSEARYKQRDIQNNENINTQISATYKATIADKHNIDAFLGAETYKMSTPGFDIYSNPTSNALTLFYMKDMSTFNDRGDNTQTRAGFMGKVNYDFDSRYLLEVQARYDGSWKFPPKHRWGFFPSVSAGWRLMQENFWSDEVRDILSNLKLRLSYGVLGDDNVSGYGAFDYLDGYNYNSGGAVIDGEYVIGASARSLAVTNISWIKSKIMDLGIDFGLFNNRLTGTFDIFRRMRTGLPASRYDRLLPSEIGFSLPAENLNSDMQQGFDGSLTWHSKIGDFGYTVGGNFTFARSYNWHQYKPLFGNSRDYYTYSTNERYYGASWAYECIGQFQSWEEIDNYPVDIDGKGNSTLRPGDLIYKDVNGDGKIAWGDKRPAGYQGYESNVPPLLNYAINLGFNWKGIDFAADFTGAAMATHWMNWSARVPFHGDNNNPQYYLGDQWRLSDLFDADSDLIPGKYPMALSGNASHSNYVSSTFWMRNVRYIKLRNLELGYTFPEKWMKKLNISKLRVYTLMQNLFSIDNVHDIGIDPEILASDGMNYPTNRVINFGLNLTF